MNDLPLSIETLRRAYAAGTATPQDTVRVAYARLAAAGDPGLFIDLVPEAAVLAELAGLPAFDPLAYPLWGVPFAVKDNIDVAGMPTTAGCPGFAYTPADTAPAVARLRAAGAILIGKTNLDQFATGLVGVRTPYPVPRNALDPALVPGGSSSGSAVAVARGIVAFALGTDTAGSGRIPAGLNNIVGLKPSPGAVSTRGVVPACRTLDCVSVFAGTVADAWTVFSVIAGADPADPFSRPIALDAPWPAAPAVTVGVPRPEDWRFFGDGGGAAAWEATLGLLAQQGARLEPIDFTPLFAVAALLYEGPWVAERFHALRAILARDPAAVLPVTRGIVERAAGLSATETFDAFYRLRELALALPPLWRRVEMLAVPTLPIAPSLADLAADPLGPNARLGTYTNFVNLLDLAALAVPAPGRPDGRPGGVTLIGPRGADDRLAGFGARVHAAAGVTIGATGVLPPPAPTGTAPPDGIELAVVGAHLSGMALNGELRALGASFVRAVATEPCYRLVALPGGPPQRPGLVRLPEGEGHAIETEVWSLPPAAFGRFVAGIPQPLGIGTLCLADGSRPKGFLCEAVATTGAEDISHFGGWRGFMAARAG